MVKFINEFQLKTFSNLKPLPQTDVQFTAIYSEGGKSKEVKF